MVYNPNDQRFYDQLNQMSNIERRSVMDQRSRDEARLKNEREVLSLIAQLPQVYQQGFKNKRERTPLKYGEEVKPEQNTATDDLDRAYYDFAESEAAPINVSAPSPAASAPAPVSVPDYVEESRFGNPGPDMGGGTSYSPGAAAVLDGHAQPGWNPPMNNPPPRPAPGAWMNETPYPAPRIKENMIYDHGSPPGVKSYDPRSGPMSEEEMAIQELQKKKEIPAQAVDGNPYAPVSSDPVSSDPAAAQDPKKDPRLSFRRFKADEFLQRNAVFQMDLPRIQPTYATMLGAETALAKSGKDPSQQKQWEILKDYETEEGQAARFNQYTGEAEAIPGVKQRPKSAAAGMPRKISEGENSVLMQMPDGTTKEIPFKPKQGGKFPILVPDGKGGSTLVYPDNQFVQGPPTKAEPPKAGERRKTITQEIQKNGKTVKALLDAETGEEIKLFDSPPKATASRDKLAQMQKEALVDIAAQRDEMKRFEKQYNEFIEKNPTLAKGFNPSTPGFAVSIGKAVNTDLEALDQTMSRINLDALVKNMRGLSRNFDTAKEAAALEAIKFKINRGEPTTRQMIEQVRAALASAEKKISQRSVKDLSDEEVEGIGSATQPTQSKRERLEELRRKKAAQNGQ